MILVDSSVWIDYFNGTLNPQTDFLDAQLGAEAVGLGDLMLTEVLQGFPSDADFETARRLLLELPVFPLVGVDMALRAAENYRSLRARGITVRKTVDTLIASFCIQADFPLLYTDRDFQPFVDHLGLKAAMAA